MKKISLVQPNFQQGPKEFNAFYLPYTVGVLWAYAYQFEFIKNNFSLDTIIFQRDKIDTIIDKLANNDVIAFSTYVWNKNYNYELAKQIKRKNSNCLIIFGGPELPITNKNIFKDLNFIDIIVKSEGEITFKKILESIDEREKWKNIKGILINENNIAIDTGDSERISDLDIIPSPYLTKVFDELIANNPNIEWNATLETNRGCPYSCTFCDWGSLTYNKVKKFTLERVFNELEWMGKNKCGFVTITDANFGIFLDRDKKISDKLLSIQEKYGFPKSFSITWAKDQKPEVFDLIFKLIKSPKFNQGLTVSVQSMDLNVLQNIKRKNLEQHKIDHVFALCDEHNVPVYTEVILGLPGETCESWKKGIYDIIRAGNHTGINILQAQLLENAEMNLLQKRIYKITSTCVYDYMSGSYNLDNIQEGVNVVTSTKDISKEEMIDCLIHNWFIQTFHINGLTTYITRFLKKYKNLDYSTFYEKLFIFLKNDVWFKNEKYEMIKYYKNWMTLGKINHPRINGIEIHGWNLIHKTTLNIHINNQYDYVFNLIQEFILSILDIKKDVIDQLLNFQKNYIINFYKIKTYPIKKTFDYDFLGYLKDEKLLNNKVTYQFRFDEDKNITLEHFLENIYFSRKRNFGKAWIKQIND